MAATPINILIDGIPLLKHFSQASVKFSEGLFCNSIDLSIVSDELWTEFDPIVNFGLLRLQVIIGTTDYEFLIEERNTTVSIPGISFTSWGRSAQALLDKPYANPLLTDLEAKVHPWQSADVTATTIINYAINYCCSTYIKSKVTVHWNVEDFIVYKDTFSTSNSSPLEIISQLAGIIGAELVANADGSLTVQEYSVGTLNPVTKLTEDISIQDYNDMDHIISLNDDIVYPIGYNSVTVNGYGSDSAGGGGDNPYLSAELQEDDLKGWEYGRMRKVKIHYYHPKGLHIGTECAGGSGSSSVSSSGIEYITEQVLLTWGSGNTQYPNTQGITDVKGNTNTPLEFVMVNYSCYYTFGYITSYINKGDYFEEGLAAFYFSDKSCMTTINYDFYDPESDPESDPYVIQMELNETDADKNQFYIKGIIYGYNHTKVKKLYSTTGSSVGQSVTYSSQFLNEDIIFTKGVGNLSHPYDGGGSYSFYNGSGHNVLFKKNNTEITISYYDPNYYPFTMEASVTYYTSMTNVKSSIPSSFTGKSFSIYLDTIDGSTLSISKTVSNEDIPPLPLPETKDISLLVKDFATDVVIPNASVTIDGASWGSTNSEGVINLIGIAVGDHTIKLIASGYLDSDEDALANDTFTVS